MGKKMSLRVGFIVLFQVLTLSRLSSESSFDIDIAIYPLTGKKLLSELLFVPRPE